MISSSNADFDAEGFSSLVRDMERAYLLLSELGIEGGDSSTSTVLRFDGGGAMPPANFVLGPAYGAPVGGNGSGLTTGVAAGTYRNADITVDRYGKITGITSGRSGGSVGIPDPIINVNGYRSYSNSKYYRVSYSEYGYGIQTYNGYRGDNDYDNLGSFGPYGFHIGSKYPSTIRSTAWYSNYIDLTYTDSTSYPDKLISCVIRNDSINLSRYGNNYGGLTAKLSTTYTNGTSNWSRLWLSSQTQYATNSIVSVVAMPTSQAIGFADYYYQFEPYIKMALYVNRPSNRQALEIVYKDIESDPKWVYNVATKNVLNIYPANAAYTMDSNCDGILAFNSGASFVNCKNVLTIAATGTITDKSKAIIIGTNQVVCERQPNITDITVTGAAQDALARSTINLILARLRTHGLIG